MDCSPPGSMGFPRQETCSALPLPSPGHLHNPRTEPASPALAGGFFICHPQERREELHGRATIPRDNQMSPSIPGKTVFLHCLDFQAEDGLTPRWHVGEPCGKASWESLVGKPRGKAPDLLILARGRETLLLQLGRKAHVHAPNRDEN